MDEAHIQHAVGFVEDKDLDLIEADESLIHEVQQASWCCDQNIDTTLERDDLGLLADTAVDGDMLE